jgi:hypothetical protein
LVEKDFRNVSIITAWNSQKDRINELGSVQFAKENNQQFIDFYFTDKWVIYREIPKEVTGHKGQEGNIAGWQPSIGLYGKLVLDTLFV